MAAPLVCRTSWKVVTTIPTSQETKVEVSLLRASLTAQGSFLAINLLSFPCSRGLEALYFCGIAFFLVSPGTLIKTHLLSVSGLSAIETGCCPSLLLAIASFCQEMTLVRFRFYFYFLPHPPPSTRLIFLKNRNQIMLHPFVNSPVTSIGSVYIWSGKQLHLYFC